MQRMTGTMFKTLKRQLQGTSATRTTLLQILLQNNSCHYLYTPRDLTFCATLHRTLQNSVFAVLFRFLRFFSILYHLICIVSSPTKNFTVSSMSARIGSRVPNKCTFTLTTSAVHLWLGLLLPTASACRRWRCSSPKHWYCCASGGHTYWCNACGRYEKDLPSECWKRDTTIWRRTWQTSSFKLTHRQREAVLQTTN